MCYLYPNFKFIDYRFIFLRSFTMLPSAHSQILLVLAILLLSASVESKTVQVPIEKLDNIFDMKLGQKY